MRSPRYLIRVSKSIIYVSVLIIAIFYVMSILNEKEPQLSFVELVAQSSWKEMIYFILIYGFVYPMIAFNSKSTNLTKPFEEQRKEIMEMMTGFKYVLVSDQNKVLHFRLISPFQRFMRLLFEDEITIDYNQENQVKVHGTHAETRRIIKRIDYWNFIEEEESISTP